VGYAYAGADVSGGRRGEAFGAGGGTDWEGAGGTAWNGTV